jgi:hypothetical protein
MIRERPLWQRLYQEEVFWETARVVGYDGFRTSETEQRIAPLVEKFGRGHVERALIHLTTWSIPGYPSVQLRSNVRPLCWQLLGPEPGTAEYERYRSPEPFVPPWQKLPKKEEPVKEKAKRRRKAS